MAVFLEVGLVATTVSIVAYGVWLRHQSRHTWNWHETPSGPIMRRWVHKKWETREMTQEEMDEYMASRMGW